MISFIVAIAAYFSHTVVWTVMLVVGLLVAVGFGVVTYLHFRVIRTKKMEIEKINGVRVDLKNGLDMIIIKKTHISGVQMSISKWEPSEVSTVHKPFTLYVDEEGKRHQNDLNNGKTDYDRSTRGELPRFGTEAIEREDFEKDSDHYTVVKTNYFMFAADSGYQTMNDAQAGAGYVSEQPKPDEDIDPANFPNRHLTFSEVEGDQVSSNLFNQSGKKEPWRPGDSPIPKKRSTTGLETIQEREEIFQFEQEHFKRNDTGEENKKNGFDSVKDDVQRVVYGDPNSSNKLAFIEKVQAMKKKQGLPTTNYDTLGNSQNSKNYQDIFEMKKYY